MEVSKTEVQCRKCGKVWMTGSNALYVTCPSCTSKTPNEEVMGDDGSEIPDQA